MNASAWSPAGLVGARGLLELLQLPRDRREGWIDEHSDPGNAARELAQEPEPLCVHEHGDPRHVVARAIEALHQAGGDRIATLPNTIGIVEVARLAASGEGSPPTAVITSTRRPTRSAAWQAGIVAARPAKLDGDVLTLDKAAFLQTTLKRRDEVRRFLRRSRIHEADHRKPLLRPPPSGHTTTAPPSSVMNSRRFN
jgi:hypothetical protein